MASLSTKIEEYAKSNNIEKVDFYTDVLLQDDGQGAYIKEWNLGIPKPTLIELDSFEDVANTSEHKSRIDHKRKSEYGDWRTQLDEIYHDIDSWKARITAVKAKYPKPE
tara:strand:+ start:156 stop:482 length:327 start_codon:yes stop_codon:yes gene_type:complete